MLTGDLRTLPRAAMTIKKVFYRYQILKTTHELGFVFLHLTTLEFQENYSTFRSKYLPEI